jgi:hypothetical protein
MKKILSISFILSIQFSLANAESQCRKVYDKQCGSSNSESCMSLNMQGEFLEPFDKDIIEEIKDKKEEILKQANTFGVSPRAIIASIIAANTINASPWNEWFKHIWYTNIKNPPAMSYGLGRLSNEKFMDIEKYSEKYIKSTLPHNKLKEQSKFWAYWDKHDIRLIAVHLKQRQEIYVENGFSDIAKNIPVLATIYGLPKLGNRPEGKQLEINTWGVVAICQEHLIDEILGTDKREKSKVSKLGQRDPAYISEFELDKDEHRDSPFHKTPNFSQSSSIQEDSYPINVIGE